MQQIINSLNVGMVFIIMGIVELVIYIKNKNEDLSDFSLLSKLINERASRFIAVLSCMLLVVFGAVLMFFTTAMELLLVIGIFFIILSIMSATRIYSSLWINKREIRYSENVGFIVGVIIVSMSMLIGIGMVLYHCLI